MMRSLTVVVPAYNEARRLPRTLADLRAYLEPRVADLEILVVDDGSEDGTPVVAREAGGDRVSIRTHERRRGKGAAVRSGVLAARCEWILVTDADLAIPIDQLETMREAGAGEPIVIGSKTRSQDRPLLRRATGAVGQALVRLLLVGGFHDTQCGFKLFRREEAQKLFALQTLDGFGYDFEILFLARRYGIGVREVPVRCADRGGGSVRWSSYARTFLELLQVASRRLLGRYPRDP